MRVSLVFTFISDDHPGVIEDISRTVADHGGNWLESEMCQLAGKFAGIIRVNAPEQNIHRLGNALQRHSAKGLKITLEQGANERPEKTVAQLLTLSIIGLDRPGILHEVTFALAEHSINISQMSTELTHAPMAGEALFNANARIEVPESVDLQALQEKLESVANALTVDIALENSE